eukprot:TRINITY_DN16378_c0_g1_i1.p1 TRINITY_DN16378_c0_g1~~TRINITY_DN16378_c0_g1_i1.p1  ORF type:complete len:168 (-),score=30.79 TRINITY_DN16378_c0_g1_i1:274-729(-)
MMQTCVRRMASLTVAASKVNMAGPVAVRQLASVSCKHTTSAFVCKKAFQPSRNFSEQSAREQPPTVVPSTSDIEINCLDCKSNFYFTPSEQQFFADKGFSQPMRCKPCRDARKRQRASSGFDGQRGSGFSNERSEGFTRRPRAPRNDLDLP